MGRLPEAWIAPPATRELRELVRHRAKLVHLRSQLALPGPRGARRARHPGAGQRPVRRRGQSVARPGPAARPLCRAGAVPAPADRGPGGGDRPLRPRLARGRLSADPGYPALQTIPGVGPILAAVFTAEIGDITRFHGPSQLASWAGLTPKHHESDTNVHRGRITKQGSRLVRWAAVESVQRLGKHTRIGAHRDAGRAPPRPQHRHRRRGPRADRVRLLRAARRHRPPQPGRLGMSAPRTSGRSRVVAGLTPSPTGAVATFD